MARLPLVLAVFALSSAAVAADLPARSDPPLAPISQPYNWTGFYAGLTAGYADPTAKIGIVPGGDWVNDPDIVGVTAAATRSLKLQGFIGGAQAGYNYQTGNLVFGVVGDISGLNVGKSYASPVFPGFDSGTYSANGAVNLNYLATLRGRAGFAVDNLLFYVTGGVAFTGEKFRQSINYNNNNRG